MITNSLFFPLKVDMVCMSTHISAGATCNATTAAVMASVKKIVDSEYVTEDWDAVFLHLTV